MYEQHYVICLYFSIKGVTACKVLAGRLGYLKKGVIKQEEEVLASLSKEVGRHVILQLHAMHALHAGPATRHPV